jgi:hypothetical protein
MPQRRGVVDDPAGRAQIRSPRLRSDGRCWQFVPQDIFSQNGRKSMALEVHRTSFLAQRALAMWPRLDRRALTRCNGDAACIARLVSKRTALPAQSIRALLLGHAEIDPELWFG